MSVSSTPNLPSNLVPLSKYLGSGVKVATPDIIIETQEVLPLELVSELIFEDIAGQEIINISRHDTINGQNVIYTPIKNAKQLAIQNSPSNILSLQGSSDKLFNSFPIKVESYVALEEAKVYYDKASRSIVLEIPDLEPDKFVEVQIISSGILLDDTIY